jgi:uncharacterized protein YndB with AHSA1/START domain
MTLVSQERDRDVADPSSPFVVHESAFTAVLGDSPRLVRVVETDAHEGPVVPDADDCEVHLWVACADEFIRLIDAEWYRVADYLLRCLPRREGALVVLGEVAEEWGMSPAEAVWDAWTKSKILDQWWAPKPWKAETSKMDFREGGHWLYAMAGPEGEKHFARVDYQSIDPGKSFVANDYFCDPNGKINPELPGNRWETHFIDQGNTTLVKIELTFENLKDLETIIVTGDLDELQLVDKSTKVYAMRRGITDTATGPGINAAIRNGSLIAQVTCSARRIPIASPLRGIRLTGRAHESKAECGQADCDHQQERYPGHAPREERGRRSPHDPRSQRDEDAEQARSARAYRE